jgi:hypothetical protein
MNSSDGEDVASPIKPSKTEILSTGGAENVIVSSRTSKPPLPHHRASKLEMVEDKVLSHYKSKEINVEMV